jgi:hypothetical protein
MADKQLSENLVKETAILVEEFKIRLIEILKNDRRLNSDSNTINSLRLIINESSKYVALMGVDYIYYVIHGRGPGRFPPPNPVTGKFEIPFPIAKEIAEKGNKAKYLHVANAFDKAYEELIEKVKKKSSEISLAYILKIGTLRNIG